jgi:cellulose biosynthesis protein BcsQ
MAKILMFGNQKGGVGKSQCSIMTASALSQAPFNLKTAIIDIDDQKSIVYARDIDKRSYDDTLVEPFHVQDFAIKDLQKNIAQLDKDYQVLIIDAAGRLDTRADVTQQEITKSLMYVDYLFIPFVAGNHVLNATFNYLQFVQQVQTARALSQRQMKLCGFVNMYRSRTKVNQFLIQDIEALTQTNDLKLMKNYLNDYTLYKEADTITSIYDPLSNDPAKQNFSEWLNELIGIIQN